MRMGDLDLHAGDKLNAYVYNIWLWVTSLYPW